MTDRESAAGGPPGGAGAGFCERCGADLPPQAAADAEPASSPEEPALGGSGEPAAGPEEPAAGPEEPTADHGRTSATHVVRNRSAGPRACRECGGEVDQDGYCTQCGAAAPKERDHFELRASTWVGGVCDRGIRHRRNEDAAAVLAEGSGITGQAALVVCDGVSSADDSDVASLAAARAAAEAIGTGSLGLAEGSALAAALRRRIEAGAAAAATAVARATADGATNPPSCTFVAAAVRGSVVVLGVVGDSRAYWLPDDGEQVILTLDDSVAGQQIAAGRPRAEAEAGPQAHAIVRWIGVDSPDQTPRLTALDVDRPGWLLLCSDGLWNYASKAADVRAVLDDALLAGGADPVRTASAMVDWANEQGGHDNITVVLARLDLDRNEGVDPA